MKSSRGGAVGQEPPGEGYQTPLERFEDYSSYFPAGSRRDRQFRLLRRLAGLHRNWRARLDDELRAMGQTRSRWDVLLFTLMSGGSASQSELADWLCIEGPTLVRLLDRLEEDRLVERLASPSDRRAKLIRATAAGEGLIGALMERVDALRTEVLSPLSDGEIDTMVGLLDKLLLRLDTPAGG